MPTCPSCGASTAPGPVCAACGRPLPPPQAATANLAALRTVAASILAVGVFVAASGFVLLGTMSWLIDAAPEQALFAGAIVVAGTVGIVSGACLLARQPWAWGLGLSLVAFGLVYAVAGLARGYSSGFVGLAVWGALGYGLTRDDVRGALGMAVAESPEAG